MTVSLRPVVAPVTLPEHSTSARRGCLLAVAHLQSVHLKQSGSRSWRPAAVASVAGIALGRIAFATGTATSPSGG
jgi:hypothetical protein